jgi:DNA-binding response OmpR family regulator
MAMILIVDDDPDIRTVLIHKLHQAGHDTWPAVDGPSGLAAATKLVPDLALLDWMLPGMSGLEICRALRADRRLKHVPVLLFSARDQESDLEWAYAAGADEFVSKPFSPRRMLERINALLPPEAVPAIPGGGRP